MCSFDAEIHVTRPLDVGLILRKAGAMATVYMEYLKDGDVWTINYKIAFKSGHITFRSGEEFDEVTPDGRNVKVKDF